MPKVIDFHRLDDVRQRRDERRLAEQLGDLDGLRAQLTKARQENKRLTLENKRLRQKLADTMENERHD